MNRDELRNQLEEVTQRVEQDKEKNVKYQKILIEENKSLSDQILQITQMYSQKGAENDKLREEQLAQKSENEALKIQLESLKDFEIKY